MSDVTIPDVVVTPEPRRMIRVPPGTVGRGVAPQAGPLPEEPAAPSLFPTVGAFGRVVPGVIGAAFELNSDVAAALDLFSRPTFPEDPSFDPMPLIADTKYEEFYLDRFVGVRSEPEARSVMARIDREEKLRETVARGGIPGTIAAIAAGILSPTSLIPVGGYLSAASRAGRAGVRAGEGAALVGGAVALQEGVLQSAQETRTGVESLFAIGGAAVLGGVLGGGIGLMTKPEAAALAKRLVDIPGSAAEQAAAWNKAVDLSSAAADAARGTGELKSALGVEKLLSFQDPLLRLQTGPFVSARNAVRDLAETPLTLAENAEGIATTIGGAVETRIKMAEAPLAQALGEMDTLYSAYFFGRPTRLAAARGTIAVALGRGGGKLTYAEFKEAVFDALLSNDVHAVKEVQDAAKVLRARVFDPWKKEAIETRLFDEGVQPLDDIGYVPRLYNTEVIRARRTEFVGILARHFEARQNELLERVSELERRTGAEGVDKAIKDLTPAEPLTAAEIRALAEETTDVILANSPERVLTPKDIVAGPRGPLKERVLRIPTTLIRDFVERDVEVLARRYTRTMAADVNLVKRFGSTDLADQIAKINDEANAKIAEATTEKARKKLDNARRAAIRDLTAIRDRIRGTYALPDNPDGLLVRAGRTIRNLNYLRLLGGMTLSAVPDIGKPLFEYGLTRTMGAVFHPFVRGMKTFRLAGREAKLAGTALDMVLDSRAMAISDIMDDYGRGSTFERAVSSATRRFGVISLMAPWNSAMKQFVGVVAQTKILQSIEKVVAGKASKAEVEYLAAAGIDANMADRIWKEFDAGGVRDGAVWGANTEAWTDRRAVESMRAALVRDIDRTIVTPGQDKPLWMSTELGKTIGQFKTFGVASVQRTILAGLQRRDAAALNGTLLMLALGALSYKLKMEAAGYEVSDDPAVWATEAFDRSGLSGWLTDVNNIAEKTALRPLTIAGLTGTPASRYASRNVYGAIFGPTADVLGDVVPLGMTGEWSAADTHVLRKLIPMQNLFYIRQLFDAAEAGANEAFGIPARKQKR